MTQTLNLGFIGCGDIAAAMGWLARLNRGIRVVACADSTQDGADAFARKFRIPFATGDYHDLLALDAVEAVYIATPHHLHDEMIRAAVAAGKHVFIEKPVTRTLAEAHALASLLEATPLKVGVNYQYRYDRGCYALARAAQSGALGRLLYARANIPWQRTDAYFERSAWHASRMQCGGGTLLTQGSHHLDMMLWAMGSLPQSAIGQIARQRFTGVEVEDLAIGTVTLDNGALIEICSSMVAAPEQATSIEVYGEKGTAIYRDRPLRHVRFKGVRPRQQRPPTPGLHPLMRSLEAFRRWIVDDQPYLVPFAEAIPVLATVEAIYRAAETGEKTPVAR